MSISELTKFVADLDQPIFRAKQLYKWVNVHRSTDVQQMTDLSKDFRNKLHSITIVSPLNVVDELHGFDGSMKFLFECTDGRRIEGVLIPEGERLTACLSSQAGCIVDCKFCATGQQGFKRNLNAGEIISQLILMEKHIERKITNIVMMGMGEPLLNRNELFKALELLTDPAGLAMSSRRLTVSTVGWLPGIRAMTKAGLKVKLAISLNATTEEQRRRWLPMAARYPIPAIVEAGKIYAKQAGNRLSISYLMLANVNDSDEDALRLKNHLRGLSCKINVMEYNPTMDDPLRSSPQRVESFVRILRRPGITVTVRTSRGREINAACGQLAGDQTEETAKS